MISYCNYFIKIPEKRHMGDESLDFLHRKNVLAVTASFVLYNYANTKKSNNNKYEV